MRGIGTYTETVRIVLLEHGATALLSLPERRVVEMGHAIGMGPDECAREIVAIRKDRI